MTNNKHKPLPKHFIDWRADRLLKWIDKNNANMSKLADKGFDKNTILDIARAEFLTFQADCIDDYTEMLTTRHQNNELSDSEYHELLMEANRL